MTDRDRTPHPPARHPHAVQPLAQPEPGRQVEKDHRWQRDEHVTAGDLGLGEVGRDPDHQAEAEAGVADPPELVRADPDEPCVVSLGERHRRHPDQRQGNGKRQVEDWYVVMTVTADQGDQTCPERRAAIDGYRMTHVRPGPASRALRGLCGERHAPGVTKSRSYVISHIPTPKPRVGGDHHHACTYISTAYL